MRCGRIHTWVRACKDYKNVYMKDVYYDVNGGIKLLRLYETLHINSLHMMQCECYRTMT